MKKSSHLILVFLISLFINQFDASARFCLTDQTNTNDLMFHEDGTGYKINVWVNTDDTPAYDCFQQSTDIKNRLPIFSRYRVVMYNYRIRHNKKHWSLLVKGDAAEVTKETIVGWVQHDFIIRSRVPLKKESNNIYIKALIKETATSDTRSLAVYTHPEKDLYRMNKFGKQEGIPVRTVFYVYDFYPRSAGSPLSPETKRVFIGADLNLNPMYNEAKLLIGWVDHSIISFWDTRTACEIKVGVNAKIKKETGENLFLPKVQKPLEYDELRDPILKKRGNKYLIGTFARLKPEQLGLKRSIANISTGLEVLFIIDGTRSMSDEFQATLKAAQETADFLSRESTSRKMEIPRFALLFYRDQPTKKTALQKKNGKVVEAHDTYCKDEYTLYPMGSMARFTSFLKSQTACDADTSIDESMYIAIIEGLQECGFTTGSNGLPKKTRIVIHMGDAGDNGRGGYSATDVSKALEKYHIFKYYSINTDPNYSINEETNVSKFTESVGDFSTPLTKYTDLDLELEVTKNLKASQIFSIQINDQIKIISRGFAGTNEGRLGTISSEIRDYARKIIKANNIDPDKLNIFQTYIEGWIEKDKVKEALLVSLTDIEKITTLLGDIAADYGNMDARRKAWERNLKMFLGGQNCKAITLEECNKIRNGIPIQAGFMRFRLEAFYNLDGQQVDDVICEARMARQQFRAFVLDKYVKKFQIDPTKKCSFEPVYELDTNGDGDVIKENTNLNKNKLKMVDKYFFREASEDMAWIPLKQLNIKPERK